MQIKELRYERKFFLGNYNTETIGVMAAVEEGEDEALILADLKKFCEDNSRDSQRRKDGNIITATVSPDRDMTQALLEATKKTRKTPNAKTSKVRQQKGDG